MDGLRIGKLWARLALSFGAGVPQSVSFVAHSEVPMAGLRGADLVSV